MKIEHYSLSGYGEMIADRVRTGAYMQALRAVIRPGDVVMDIGTGPGIMAVLACQLGAKRVYAIEPGEIIQLAREIAAANQVAEKIEFFEDVSTNVTIPERADVIVSDLRGVLPFYSHHIPAIVDARLRFLAPGGTLIGREDRVWAAVVQAPERYSLIVGAWERELPGQDLSPARRKAVNEIYKMLESPALLITHPELWVALDYMRVEDPDVEGKLTLTVKSRWDRARDCTLVRCGPGRGRRFFEQPQFSRRHLHLDVSSLAGTCDTRGGPNSPSSTSSEGAGGRLFLALDHSNWHSRPSGKNSGRI